MLKAKSTGRVLVLGHGGRAFLSVIRSLGRAGLQVHVGMCPADDLALRSRYVRKYHRIPAYRPDSSVWLEAMFGILTETTFDLIVPCNDHAVIPVQIHKDRLCRFAQVYALSDRAYEVAFNKIASFRLARRLGVPVPRSKVVFCGDPVDTVLDGLSLPVVLKPPSSFCTEDLTAKRAVFRARNRNEVEAQLRACNGWREILVQENFVGTGVGVEVLAHEGRTLVAFQHVRIHEPPEGGGSSYRRSAPLHPGLAAASRALMDALGYTGVAMVEFKFNFRTGHWVLIEINGRFWGSLPLAMAARVDFPLYLYQMLVKGRTSFPRSYATGVYCRNLAADCNWMAANLRANRKDPVLATRSPGAVALEVLNVLTLRERWDTVAGDDLRPGIEQLTGTLKEVLCRGTRVLGRKLAATNLGRELGSSRLVAKARKARIILFVCKGNICRSPFAERYAARTLPRGIKVFSCGYYPASGRASPEAAVFAAYEFGVDLTRHRSTLLNADAIQQADVILVFDEHNRGKVLGSHPSASGRLFNLGVLLKGGAPVIPDPYGGDESVFRVAYARIVEALDRLAAAVSRQRRWLPSLFDVTWKKQGDRHTCR